MFYFHLILIFFYVYHAEVHTASTKDKKVLTLKELWDLNEKHSLMTQQEDATAIIKTKGEEEEEEEEETERRWGGDARASRCYRGQVLSTWRLAQWKLWQKTKKSCKARWLGGRNVIHQTGKPRGRVSFQMEKNGFNFENVCIQVTKMSTKCTWTNIWKFHPWHFLQLYILNQNNDKFYQLYLANSFWISLHHLYC